MAEDRTTSRVLVPVVTTPEAVATSWAPQPRTSQLTITARVRNEQQATVHRQGATATRDAIARATAAIAKPVTRLSSPYSLTMLPVSTE